MATKLQFYSALAEQTIDDLTAKRGNWMRFLDTAAQLYKYPFHDQLMIYAQRPDATACAELELWNEQFNRWVRRGSKGIALIDDSGSYPRLKYVFDVSDTEASLYRARPIQLWEMRQEHKEPVLAALAKTYDDVGDTLADSFRSIAKQLASEYYEDNSREITFRAENSRLEPYPVLDDEGNPYEQRDDTELRAQFIDKLTNSVAYVVMSRCGIDTAEYFSVEDFNGIFDFSTQDITCALGVAASDLSEQVLRDIEITIKKYERTHAAERSEKDYDQNLAGHDAPYLHAERGLSAPRHHAERTAEGVDAAAGPLRENEESVPQGAPRDNVQPPAAFGEAVPAPAGGGSSGDGATVAGDERADGEQHPARQGDRPDGLDGGDERAESAGRGNGAARTDLRIEETLQTLSQFGNSSIDELLSTSPITMDEVDSILRNGANSDSSTLRIAARFAKGKTAQELTDYLRREYLQGRYNHAEQSSGKGFDFAGTSGTSNHHVCAWYDEAGIQLAVGTTAKNNIHAVTIPWEQAAARINELMRGGRYVSRGVFAGALDNERYELAGRLWDFYRDDMHDIPQDFRAEKGGYPEDRALIKSLLDDESHRQRILDRLDADVDAWNNAPESRSWHNPNRLLADMRDAMLPPVIIPDDNYSDTKTFSYFITQDEIDALLTRGGAYSEGKFRFLSFFLGDHSEKEKADFVKREYGHGGGTWSATNGWQNAEPGKGITLQRGSIGNPAAEVNLKWNAVIRRTEQLIAEGRYMTRAELDHIPNYERLMLVRKINSFFYDLPAEYERPFPGKFGFSYNEYRDENGEKTLDFTYPREAEWQAIRDLLDNPEHVESLLSQMRYIFENTSAEDRYYSTRKVGFEALTAFQAGTYTLFPGIKNLPDPETAAIRRIEPSATPRRELVEDLREPSMLSEFRETPRGEQLTLFDVAPPVLPSVYEQREQIHQKLQQEAERIMQAEAGAPALTLPVADDQFLNISNEDKARIAAQFADNPRSREAVSLVREVYGDSLDMSLPQAVKRITELVNEGKFTAAAPIPENTYHKLTVLQECERIKRENDGAVVMWQVGDFFEMYGVDAEISTDVLNLTITESRAGLPEPVKLTGIPRHTLNDNVRKLNEAGYTVAVADIGADNERHVTVSAPKPTQIELDFDTTAQTILERVMANADYTDALANAQSRSSLRNPCTLALEHSIREHQADEPEVYRRYFGDDDFNDGLFDFVLKQSWEQRPQTAEVGQQARDSGFTEITDPAVLAEIEEVFGGGESEQKPPTPRPVSVNFRITDEHLGEGGAKTKFHNNIKALQTLKNIELENRAATPVEQEALSRYVGWGGVQEAFDPENKAWANEYQALNAMLTPEEWESARATVLNAHYTSPTVIKAIYETIGRLGFKSGNILEPACGVGNFFGLLPESMQGSKLYGVEIDSVTARIAKHLYPKADIQQMGFENTQYPDAFFDVAVGNVPFGGYGVVDKRYKTNFQIHDYFFQKTFDKVRPGGIIAFVTSKGTLDKKNPEARKYMAQRAELLGAVRLPNNAFLKNAGTEVTTDILFFQKRDRPLDIEPDWVHLGLTEDGLPINRYFLDNPEMLLGTMSNETGVRMYGNSNSTTCIPFEGADLAKQLNTAFSYIQGQYTVEELDDLDGVDDHAIPADPNVKNFSYALITPTAEPDNVDGRIYAATVGEGQVYFRENSLMYPVDLPAMTLDRIRGMIGLRDCVGKLIALQLDDYSDEQIKAQQAELNTLYDGFIAEFGLISSQANSRAFNADSSYYLLSALEIINEDGELERKADMFTKRTIKQRTVITHVDTASEALAVSLGEKARVDLEYMSELTGFSREKLLDDLQGVIFLNVGSADSQERAYVTADEYLSGNVREKLRQAEAAAEAAPSLDVNVAALRAIQPKDLEAGEIAVRLGATWIDAEYVQQFMYELLNTNWRNQSIYQVKYHQYTGEWQVTGKNKSQYSDINATVTYGTSRMNAFQIIDDTLNLRDVRVYDYKQDADGRERRVLNKKETMLAQQKQELIKQKFCDWIWQDPQRRQTLVRQYNELFNSVRPREYDGSHITFDGMNPEIKLSKHQVDGAARHLYGGNTLYAHVVGAGKTFTMIAAAMEGKRLGLCQKSLFAVPNHLTE